MSERTRRRQGRRGAAQGPPAIEQPPFRLHRRSVEPTRVVSDDELEAVHESSLAILRDVGIDVLLPDARARLEAAGCTVSISDDRVRFDPEMVMDYVGSAPAEFTLHARNPAHTVQIGGDNVVFSAVASPPNVSDAAGGRRTGNMEDFQNLVRLSQHLNAVQVHAGYPVEPADVHASVRHLHAIADICKLSDKAVNAYSLGADRNRDALEILRIAHQLSDDEIDVNTIVYSVINTSSPLRLDEPMCTGIIEYAARNQAVVVTPFTLAGAMAPARVNGVTTTA